MTWIFLSPAALRTTSKVVLPLPPGPRQPPPPPAAIIDHAASGGFDAVGFLEIASDINGLLEGQTGELVAQFFDFCCYFCHDFISWIVTWSKRVEFHPAPIARLHIEDGLIP